MLQKYIKDQCKKMSKIFVNNKYSTKIEMKGYNPIYIKSFYNFMVFTKALDSDELAVKESPTALSH